MFEVIGWLGAVFLAICGVPQAFKSYKEGNSYGLSWIFILLWFFGEVLILIYILPNMMIPLILNYSLNIIIVMIILWYKCFPRK